MDISRLKQNLQSLSNKLEKFATTLDFEERDALAAIFQLSVVGASQTKDMEPSTAFMINAKLCMSVASQDSSILACLPNKILNATKHS